MQLSSVKKIFQLVGRPDFDAFVNTFFFGFGSNLLCSRDSPYVTHLVLRVGRGGHNLDRH